MTAADIEHRCGTQATLATPEAERDNLGPDRTCSRRFSNGPQMLNFGLILEPTQQQAAAAYARAPAADAGNVTTLSGIGQGARSFTALLASSGQRVLKVEFQKHRFTGFISTGEAQPLCSGKALEGLARLVSARLQLLEDEAPARPEKPLSVPSLPASGPERFYKLAGLTCGAVATNQDVAAACGAAPAEPYKPQADVPIPVGASCMVGFSATSVIGPTVNIKNFSSVVAAKAFFDRPYRAGFGLTKIRQLPDIGNQARLGTTTGEEWTGQPTVMARAGNVVVQIDLAPPAGLSTMCSEDGMVKLAKRIVARLK